MDTSVYCQPLRPRPLASVEERWRRLGDNALATSVFCEAELLYGLEWKQSERLGSLYQRFLRDRLPVLPFDSAVAQTFGAMKAECRRQGFTTSDFDLLIASTAKFNGLILATLNVRHFSGIPGLALEDWTSY